MTERKYTSECLMPQEVWGDFKVPRWSRLENGHFEIYLTSISSSLLFVDNDIQLRVKNEVQDIIDQAKLGLIELAQAKGLLDKRNLFDSNELVLIKQSVEMTGEKIGTFLKNMSTSWSS